jgi:hypothetical protein
LVGNAYTTEEGDPLDWCHIHKKNIKSVECIQKKFIKLEIQISSGRGIEREL